MKVLPLICLILLSSCSRFSKLEGKYFSDSQDCMILDDKTGDIENKADYIKDNLSLKQTNDKLKFRWITKSPRRLLFKKNIYRYYFRIIYKTADSFMVSPASRLSKEYFKHRDSIVFKLRYRFADPTNYFTRIIFHSSRCFGFCDDLHLELDYSGNLKVTNNGNGRTDSGRNDNYLGKVSFEDLDRLKNVLKYSQLKTLEWPPRNCYDAPELTLILYQNDKRYYFKINKICVPLVSSDLTRFLSQLFRYETLKRVDTTFTYER